MINSIVYRILELLPMPSPTPTSGGTNLRKRVQLLLLLQQPSLALDGIIFTLLMVKGNRWILKLIARSNTQPPDFLETIDLNFLKNLSHAAVDAVAVAVAIKQWIFYYFIVQCIVDTIVSLFCLSPTHMRMPSVWLFLRRNAAKQWNRKHIPLKFDSAKLFTGEIVHIG